MELACDGIMDISKEANKGIRIIKAVVMSIACYGRLSVVKLQLGCLFLQYGYSNSR